MAAEGVLHVKLLNEILRIVLNHADLFQHHLFFFFNLLGIEPRAVE